MGNKAWLVSGDKWMQWDTANDRVIQDSTDTSKQKWFGQLPTPFNAMIDAMANGPIDEWMGPQDAFVWSGSYWMRWNTLSGEVVDGPYHITVNPWSRAIPAPFNTKAPSPSVVTKIPFQQLHLNLI